MPEDTFYQIRAQINHDNVHDYSKTRTHGYNKLPGDGDPCAPNNITENLQQKKKVFRRSDILYTLRIQFHCISK